jgi:transposase
MAQITVISGVERRRRWSGDQKLALVRAATAPGASVVAIARSADVAPSLIYRWRREIFASASMQLEGFTAVAVRPVSDRHDRESSGTMVIELGGATVRVANGASASLLVATLRELKR